MTCFKTSLPRTALLFALTACGGGIANPSAQASANEDAGSSPPPVPVNEDAGSPPPLPPGPAPTTCNTLSLAGPAQTVQAGGYGALAADSDGVLVGIVEEDSTPPFAYHFWARELSFDGTPLAPGVDLFEDSNGVLAAAGGHAAALGSNSACAVTLLGPDATPEGNGSFDANVGCMPFIATASGFAMVAYDSAPSTSLVTTDASGVTTSTGPVALPGGAIGMAALRDGSFLLLESSQTFNCGIEDCPQDLYVQHVDTSGQLGSLQQVGSIPPESNGPTAIVAVGDGALVAISPTSTGAAVTLQAVDRNGNLVGQATNLGNSNGITLIGLGLAAVQTDVGVVAWVDEPPGSAEDRIVAQAVSSGGVVLSPLVMAPSSLPADYGYGVGVVATPAGALLAWETTTSVMAAPLSCAP